MEKCQFVNRFHRIVCTASVVFVLQFGGCEAIQAQSYLGLDGGLEGSATVDNSNLYSAGQDHIWAKANANQTIAYESTIVRSGSKSLKISNSSTTGRRCYTPAFSPALGQRLVVQFYRRIDNLSNTQLSHCEISRDGTTSLLSTQSATYTLPAAVDYWEKVTFTPTSTDYVSKIWACITHKQSGSGGALYIDDFCIYAASAIDNTAPDAPSGFVPGTTTSASIPLSWSAPATGTDNGGYLLVRGETDPATAPNVNGIYAAGNAIGAGTVVYQGIDNSFSDTGLTPGTHYYYRLYTFDKAYNYSTPVLADATTSVATALNEIPDNAALVAVKYFTLTGLEVKNPSKGVFVQKSYYDNGAVVTRKVVK